MNCRTLSFGIAAAFIFATTTITDASARLPRVVTHALEAQATSENFNGVALVSINGRTAYERAFGTAERSFSAPATTDTHYPIASITKLFTSVLILQLVDNGAIALDTPFGAYLPDYAGEGGDRVTVRMLMNHTSGIAQFDTVASYQEAFAQGLPNYQRPLTTGDLMRVCCSGSLAAPPGARFDYNNADYFILGRIIERATGLTYEQALRTRILEPLGLRDTGALHWHTITPRMAPTYFHRDDTDTLVRDMPIYWENADAAGSLYSTTGDLARFADAVFAGSLISEAAGRELLTPALDEYGLGLWSYSFERNGRTYRVAKRPGSIMGANTVLYRLVDQNITIVLLANTNMTDLDAFAQDIAAHLIDAGIAR